MEDDVRALLSSYDIDENGLVRTPGQFEGAPTWVVAFWDLATEGWGEALIVDGVTSATGVIITTADIEKNFPTLAGHEDETVVLWQDENGFVRYAWKDDLEKAGRLERTNDYDTEDDDDDDDD